MARGPNQSHSQKRAAKTRKRADKRRGQLNLSTVFRTPLDQFANVESKFRSWLVEGDGCPGQDAAADVADSVEHAIAVLAHANPKFTATAWRPEDVDYLLDVVLTSDLVVDDTMARQKVVADVAMFVSFLSDSGGWSGSDDDLGYCLTAMMDYLDPESFYGSPSDLSFPEVDSTAELGALLELPAIERLTALVEWVGRGRAVTTTGALKLALVPEAAALFGVDAVVATKRREEAQAELSLFPEPLDGHSPRTTVPVRVRSMWDLPVLASTWSVAVQTGLLAIGSTVVRPGPAADIWDRPDADPRAFLDLCRRATAESIVAHLGRGMSGAAGQVEDALNAAATAVVFAGFTDQAVPSDPRERTVPLVGSSESGLSDVLEQALFTRVDQLVDEGILDNSNGYRVRDQLKPAAQQALCRLLDDETAGVGVPDAHYTVKISLKGTTPPVWRRIVLNGAITLGDLHRIIQACFDWDDSHLHAFRLGSRSVSDDSVALAAVLPDVGDRITYVYDFGDDWTHDVVVEAIAETGDTAPALRCVTGRGMAPPEDSGGPWGWANLVEVANDPHADDHDEIREWLGLQDGQAIDPKAFDIAEVNTRLERVLR